MGSEVGIIIADSELLYRRIPPVTPFFEPPDRITSANFKLGSDESGLSVYRANLVSANSVLQSPDALPNSFLVQATAGDVRRLCKKNGETCGLDVVIDDPDGTNPGHALVVVGPGQAFSKAVSKALSELFRRA